MIKLDRQKLAEISLLLFSFFLPFGYDWLFKVILDLTKSYWTTDFIFYGISFSFFGLYLYFSHINPFKGIINVFKMLKDFINQKKLPE